ncbi:bifunctional 4-hydroxy-2-oxoglutarate aldolase/2-dehydro-3-deoxy-phosphogluconate aldolase [uncultured Pseudokineococcus sp.]|uniref:bifunctional 4-hydroxy-2-oxoglutarate aldolase/2-dehydro-3-deoxy-phosphogluconate aldolase n=1 Tax=uncultured Pseudokineococcus sp. TaxID=1642928 RepID=UPI002635CE04|nr:bifunctional 4-hydroxy-2-oxoglutarate aldolase/2-dehydro-3-deoxy-phosphogluconate aldolase [uncultured Pseudokineococcus sp.]
MTTPDRPTAAEVMGLSPVIPVVVLDDPEAAVPLARALHAGGVGVVELTLRTPTALESARRIAAEVPEVVLGVGTCVSAADVERSVEAGARFVVSPGSTPAIIRAAQESGVAVLPGVSTVSEALAALELGVRDLKFFPAEQAGGAPFLGALRSPLPQLRFCPTGGISQASAPDYLGLSNVPCVGGSWLTPASVVAEGRFGEVERLAREAVEALGPHRGASAA